MLCVSYDPPVGSSWALFVHVLKTCLFVAVDEFYVGVHSAVHVLLLCVCMSFRVCALRMLYIPYLSVSFLLYCIDLYRHVRLCVACVKFPVCTRICFIVSVQVCFATYTLRLYTRHHSSAPWQLSGNRVPVWRRHGYAPRVRS